MIRADRRPGSAHLTVEIQDDRCILSARLKRTFPLSEPNRFISIQEANGKEVGLLTALDGLESGTRSLFAEQLDRTYFTPRIERILVLKSEAGMWRFQVVTQRGETEFFVRNWRDSAVEIAAGRWHIQSADGARFEILNLEGLDVASRRLMDQVL